MGEPRTNQHGVTATQRRIFAWDEVDRVRWDEDDTEGQMLTVGDETREIGPGDGWYAPGDVPHGGEVLGDEAAVFIDVYSPATDWILGVFAEARPVPAFYSQDVPAAEAMTQ